MSVEIKNNLPEFNRLFDEAITAALEAIGARAEGYAVNLCPVDTGRLRASIEHFSFGYDEYIGTNVKYGKYVELGTRKMKAQPFLMPAATEHGAEYQQIFGEEFGKVMKKLD